MNSLGQGSNLALDLTADKGVGPRCGTGHLPDQPVTAALDTRTDALVVIKPGEQLLLHDLNGLEIAVLAEPPGITTGSPRTANVLQPRLCSRIAILSLWSRRRGRQPISGKCSLPEWLVAVFKEIHSKPGTRRTSDLGRRVTRR